MFDVCIVCAACVVCVLCNNCFKWHKCTVDGVNWKTKHRNIWTEANGKWRIKTETGKWRLQEIKTWKTNRKKILILDAIGKANKLHSTTTIERKTNENKNIKKTYKTTKRSDGSLFCVRFVMFLMQQFMHFVTFCVIFYFMMTHTTLNKSISACPTTNTIPQK